MGFVQFCQIIQIHLKDPSSLGVFFIGKDLLLCGHYILPKQFAFIEWFAHGPPVKVVRVEILDVIGWLVWVVTFNMRIVGFCIPFAHQRNPTLSMHVYTCQQLQLHSCLFQHCIPKQVRQCIVLCQVQSILF